MALDPYPQNVIAFIERPPSGGYWSAPQVIDSGSGLYSLVYDGDDNPSILYSSGGRLKLARRLNNVWQIQTVNSDFWGGGSLVYDPLGNLWVSFGSTTGKGKNAKSVLKVAGWNPATQIWDTEVVDPDAAVDRSSMAFGATGLVIAYRVRVNVSDSVNEYHVRFANWNGTSFDRTTLGMSDVHLFGLGISLAINPITGRPAVTFRDEFKTAWFFERKILGDWFSEHVALRSYPGDLVYHPSGVPYLPLVELAPESLFMITLARKVSGIWQVESVVGLRNLPSPSLAFTPTGAPAVAIFDERAGTAVFAERSVPVD